MKENNSLKGRLDSAFNGLSKQQLLFIVRLLACLALLSAAVYGYLFIKNVFL